MSKCGRVSASCPLELERDTVIAGGAEELPVMRRTKDVDECRFRTSDPFHRWQATDSSIHPLARDLLFFDEDDHASEEALEEVEKVRDGRNGMSKPWEERGVEHHLPLDASLAREEGRRVDGDL